MVYRCATGLFQQLAGATPLRIQNKLFLALMAISALLVLVMLGLMRWSVAHGMLDYVNLREAARLEPLLSELADHYQQEGNWHALRQNPRQFERLLGRSQDAAQRPPLPPSMMVGGEVQEHGQVAPRDGRHRPHRVRFALLDGDQQVVLGKRLRFEDRRSLPIVVSDEVVGWLALPSRKRLTEGYELRFVEQQGEALLAIGLLVTGLALLFAYLLSRHLLQPISALAGAASAMTQGNYAPVINLSRRDELGQLARDVNELAAALAQSDAARKHWFADVSHELRTPLAILYAEIEAMLDGMRPIDEAAVRSLQQEISQLNTLVDDLYTLSNADLGALQYHKTWLDLNALVARQVAVHRTAMSAAGLDLQLVEHTAAIELCGDRARLCQLLDNLLVNSCKYTDAPGQVMVSLELKRHAAVIRVEDSAPGVPDEAHGALFEHLYRVDQSRNRATGGSGLGLAICRRIVAAHDGEVAAGSSALGGLAITVTLPLGN